MSPCTNVNRGLAGDRVEVGQVARVGQLVQHRDAGIGKLRVPAVQQRADVMRADKACPARYQNPHAVCTDLISDVPRLDRRVIPGSLGADLNPAVVAEDQPVRLRYLRRRRDLDRVTDQRRLNPPDTADGRPSQHDRVLDLAVLHHAVRPDRGKRPDIRVSDLSAGPDDRRPRRSVSRSPARPPRRRPCQ